jgi:exonuclease SbcD
VLIFHTGDNHYSTKTLEYVDKAMHFAIDKAIEAKVEAFVMAGDTFDSSIAAHDPAYHACMRAISRMLDHAPVIAIYGTGSHDRAGVMEPISHMRGRHPIWVSDRPQQVGLFGNRWHDLAEAPPTEGMRLLVSAFPGMNIAELHANNPAALQSEYTDSILQGWLPSVREARFRGVPTVLALHGTIQGAVSEGNHAFVSQDREFSPRQLLDAENSATMAAHIHKAQDWSEQGRRVAYCGSITKLVYGFKGAWGALIWDVRADGADFSRIETPTRDLVEIDFNGPPDMIELARRLQTCRGASLRIRWSVDEEFSKQVDQEGIREILTAAGVAEFKLEGRINPVQRQRAAGISQAASTETKLRRWAEITGSNADPLVERLRALEATA